MARRKIKRKRRMPERSDRFRRAYRRIQRRVPEDWGDDLHVQEDGDFIAYFNRTDVYQNPLPGVGVDPDAICIVHQGRPVLLLSEDGAQTVSNVPGLRDFIRDLATGPTT